MYEAIKDTDLEQILSTIGTDGTAVMTGCDNDCIWVLEEFLERPLQWSICLLHCNELPLRHVFTHIDRTTKSRNSFGGVIGKQISGSKSNWEVKRFNPIPFTDFPILSQSIVNDLSSNPILYFSDLSSCHIRRNG